MKIDKIKGLALKMKMVKKFSIPQENQQMSPFMPFTLVAAC